MARYRGSVCRLCRRETIKLFLKGERCLGEKCAVDRRNYVPGQHGQKRGKVSDYGVQLREKQKAKRIYGLLENQFRNYFLKAERQKGVTGTNLLVMLERRMDNVIYRLGFATSRNQARQLVRHGYFTVNGKQVNIPSYAVSSGDKIALVTSGREVPNIVDSLKNVQEKSIPKWLKLDVRDFSGVIEQMPEREDIDIPVTEQLIVELYSK